MPTDTAPSCEPGSDRLPAAPDAFARGVLDALASHMAVVDAAGTIITVNQAWRDYAARNGGDPDKVSEGSNYLRVCDPADGDGVEYARSMAAGLRAVLAGEQAEFAMEYPCACYDGMRWFMARVTPCHEATGAQAVINHENITERKKLENRLKRQAYFDQLTGLPNRSLITHRLREAESRCQQEPGRRFALLFLDFDGFKRVNDTMGHDVGDALLCAIAQRIRQTLGVSDDVSSDADDDATEAGVQDGPLAARLGGDEFVVLLDGVTDETEAERVADELLASMQSPFDAAGFRVNATASIGLALGAAGSQAADRLLSDADLAMYQAKQHGKNQFTRFEPDMRASA